MPWSATPCMVVLFLFAGCSESTPEGSPQSFREGVVQPTPALPGFTLPALGVSSASTDVGLQSPEEIVATLPPAEQARTVINALAFFLTAYRCHTGQFPSQHEGLKALVERPESVQPPESWQGSYSPESFLTDPWGRPYQYRWLDGAEILFDLRSLGPDGVQSEDDLTLDQLRASAQFARRDYIEHFTQLYSRQRPTMPAVPELHPDARTD